MSSRFGAISGAALLTAAFLFAGCSAGTASPAPASTSTPTATSAASQAVPSAAALPTGSATCTEPASSGAVYSMSTCQVAAPSLAGNLLGDPATLNAYILTPSDYASSGKRYPVVYVLAGYTDPATGLAYSLGAAPDADAGKTSPIVVIVSGVNALGGGFYVNSPVTGNWEDAITKDLIGYVDGHYRTLAKAASRGIAGHSMGGFGALNIATLHPELFSVLFAEAPGAFNATNAEARIGKPAATTAILDLQKEIAGLSRADALDKITTAGLAGGEDVRFELAYGMAFAPNASSPILMDFPYKEVAGKTVRDDAVWAKWEAGFGDIKAEAAKYKSNLAAYKGIAVDWGTKDEYAWIPEGCAYLVEQLKANGINVTSSSFDGGHDDQAGTRLTGVMLPFMEKLLATN